MSSRDWDKELAAIDRQLASIPDEALVAKPQPAPAAPAARDQLPARGAARPAAPSVAGTARRPWKITAALLLRFVIGAAGVAALVLWPYVTRCGPALAGYLAAVVGVALVGLWTSVAAWRHRAPLVHTLGLALVVISGVLAAREVLPRVGYALPSLERPAIWACQ